MSRKDRRNKLVEKTVNQAKGPVNLVVSELNVISADRTQKDIQSFKSALESAESIWSPNRVALYDLYEHVMLDGHLSGIISKRIDAILNKVIYFEDKTGKKVDQFDGLIKSAAFRELIRKLIEAPIWGVSGIEFIPGAELTFEEIPRKHIKPELGLITYDQYGNTGIEYKDVENIFIIGKKKDLGLLLKCSPYAIWKRGNMADWSQYIEIFGQPVRIIYYDAYDQKTKMELKTVLDNTGSSLALMIPNQAKFELMDGKSRAGDGQLQERFNIACNTEMSIIILGNTETTSSSSSSGYAQSKEHSKQQLEITKSDMKYVMAILNSPKFLRILQTYGYPVEGGFKFEKEVDLEAMKVKADIDSKVASIVPVSDDYWYETYGIPKPDNYDELKAQKEADKEAARKALEKPAPTDPKGDPKKEDPKKKTPEKKGSKKDLNSASVLFRLRSLLADFFDPAP